MQNVKTQKPTWAECERKHEMWINDRETFCINMIDPKDETEFLLEEARILLELVKAINSDIELYWED